MINVFIYKDRAENFISLQAYGHADFNEKGKDIVCAGTSALLETCALGIKKQKIKSRVSCKKERLTWKIFKNNTGEKIKKANLLIDTMLLGLYEIQKKFPKNLKISIRRS